MAHLYSNENFPYPTVKELRRLGHDVLTVLEAGKAEQAIRDEEVLAFAAEQSWAVLTLNRKHFIALHNSAPDHAVMSETIGERHASACRYKSDVPEG